MSPDDFQIRRATIDDLDALRGLWQTALHPAHELEKQLTNFQIVEGSDGRLIGAIGVRIAGADALLHHEAFTHPDTEDTVRQKLWDRLKTMANNNGVHRLWTCEKSAFWEKEGFEDASPNQSQQVPAAFGNSNQGWRILMLRNQDAEQRIEQELMFLKAAQSEDRTRLEKQAKVAKVVAGVIVVIVVLLLLVYAVFALFKIPNMK